MSLIKLNFKGAIGAEFGDCHEYEALSIFEAFSILQVNFATFRAWVRARNFHILVDGKKIETHQIYNDYCGRKIEIIPVIAGAGRGLLQLIAGVALIGLSFASVWLNPAVATAVFNMGVGLALSGVAGLMTGDIEDDAGVTGGNYSGPATRDAEGRAVPVGIGEAFISLNMISHKIRSKEL